MSAASLKALRSTLGRKVYQVFARSLEVHGEVVLSSHFSVALDAGSYCVIENDWADTPRAAIDYYFLEASIRDWPKGVGRAKDEDGYGGLANPSIIGLQTPAAAVAEVVVLDHRETVEDESVHYDHAIVFTRKDGYRFAFSAFGSALGYLEFTDREERVGRLISEFSERIRLC